MQKISALCFLSLVYLASAQIIIAPSSINFGDVQIDQAETVEKIAYVINVGDESVTMSGVGGGLSSPFSVVQNCQGNLIAPGQACNMYFYFNSDTTGAYSAVSQGTWNTYPYNISLTANAVLSELNIAPTSLDFGNVTIGESAQRIVYITNVGEAILTLSGVGGGIEAPFIANQNCQDEILAPGHSCEMVFTFVPTTNGSVTATSSGTWNDIPFNISLRAASNTAEIEA